MSAAGSRTFRALGERNARFYFGGLLLSNVGTWLQATAQVLLVRRLGGGGLELGLVLACQYLPMLVLGLWAGALADRHDRRRLTLLTQTGMGVQAVVLGVFDLAGAVTIGGVYALTLVLGVLSALDNPARRGLATELVDEPDLANVLALNTAVMTGSRVFGPALAAVLVAWVGTGWCFVINGVSFIALLVALAAIDPTQLRRSPSGSPSGQPVRDGLRTVWATPVARTTLVVFSIVATFTFNYAVAMPLLITHRLDADDGVFGWLLSTISVGSVAGSLLTAGRSTIGPRWFYGALGVLCVGNVVVATAPTLWVAYLGCLPLGAGGAAFIAAGNVILQNSTPAQMRSRVLALTAVAFLGSTPIGGPITGLIGDTVGATWSMLYGGLIGAACLLWGVSRRVATP
jgi:MFS family permease